MRLYRFRRWGDIKALIAGPDRRLWFAADRFTPRSGDPAPTEIVAMTTRGRTTVMASFGPSEVSPDVSLTSGGDGNVWAATAYEGQGDTGRILRITPGGALNTFRAGLPSEGFPSSLVAGPDGNVWLTLPGGSERPRFEIGRVTPTGEITTFSSLIPGVARQYPPSEITPGPDGALWFTTTSGYTQSGCAFAPTPVGRITTDGEVSRPTQALLNQPFPLLFGPDSRLWIGEVCPNRIARLGTDGEPARSVFRGEPSAFTVGPAGRPWFTGNGPSIGYVTSGGRVISRRLELGRDNSAGTYRGPFLGQGLAYGSDRGLWVATVGGSERLVLARYRP